MITPSVMNELKVFSFVTSLGNQIYKCKMLGLNPSVQLYKFPTSTSVYFFGHWLETGHLLMKN